MAEPPNRLEASSALGDEHIRIRRLVREIGSSAGRRPVSADELEQLRDVFGHLVLSDRVDGYVMSMAMS